MNYLLFCRFTCDVHTKKSSWELLPLKQCVTNMILSCTLTENIIIADFTYLFPSAGLPSRTSSSSTYFVCPWFFQMSAVSFLYFSLEAIKTMYITKLQTFSTGNRTLKREMYFITLLKISNYKKTKRSCGLCDYRNKYLCYDMTFTHLKFLHKLFHTEHYQSDVTHLVSCPFIHVVIDNYPSSATYIMQETAWYTDLIRRCSISLLFPVHSLLFLCKHYAYHQH